MATRLKQISPVEAYRFGMLMERNQRLRAQADTALARANACVKEAEALMAAQGLNLAHQVVTTTDQQWPLGAVLDAQGNPVVEEVPDAPQLTLVPTPMEQTS
jgi:hypothetical protein